MPAPKKAKKAVKSRRADTADGAEEASLAAVPQSPPEPPRSLRVLLVDDDAEIIESMRTVLESKGYEILVARDGNQGLLIAERENPDLVVLDMMMPKRSGFLVLERLRRSRPVPMRVIMITANEGSRHRAYAEMLGVDDYIRKPFAMDRLLDSVQRLLGAAR
ncbi:MAG: response regulator [Planctomycetia bacterium]|jgi:DNA-binding response OmpR family regulator